MSDQEGPLGLDDLSLELKRLGVKPHSRMSLWRLHRDHGAAGPIREEEGRLVGKLGEVIEFLRSRPKVSRKSEQAPGTPLAAPRKIEDVAELLDAEILEEPEGEADDPEFEYRAAIMLMRKLEKIIRALKLRKLNEGKTSKSGMAILEIASRTLARTAKAKEDLLRVREREKSLLELALVQKLLDRLGGLHVRRFLDIPGMVVMETMAVLMESGIEPRFSSDLLKDRLAVVVDKIRETMADDVKEVARELAA